MEDRDKVKQCYCKGGGFNNFLLQNEAKTFTSKWARVMAIYYLAPFKPPGKGFCHSMCYAIQFRKRNRYSTSRC